MSRSSLAACAAGVAMFLLATTPQQGRAQFLPQPGFGSFSTTYQFAHAKYHLFSQDLGKGNANRMDLGHMDYQTLLFNGSYNLLRGLTVSGSAAYESSRYLGDQPEAPTDTRNFSGAWQDASIGTSYTGAWQGITFTPGVSYTFPMSNYTTMGHTAVGRGLKSFGMTLSAARGLYPLLPDSYIAAGIERDLRQDLQVWGMNGTTFTVGGGYFFTAATSLGAHFSYSHIKGGFDWANPADWQQPDSDMFHDQAAGSLVRSLGGTFTYRFNSTYSLGVDVSGVLSGANTTDPMSYSIATNYGFWAPFTH